MTDGTSGSDPGCGDHWFADSNSVTDSTSGSDPGFGFDDSNSVTDGTSGSVPGCVSVKSDRCLTPDWATTGLTIAIR